jgi:hypothetical protein
MPAQTSVNVTCTAISYDNLLAYAGGNMTTGQSASYKNYLRSLFMMNGLLPLGAEDDCNDAEVAESYISVLTNVECPAKAIVQCVFVAIDACGNMSEEQITQLIVVDATTPHIFGPADITVACDGDSTPEVTGYATATDNCGGGVTISYVDTETNGFCPTSIIRMWTAVDPCGNYATHEQLITMVENADDCAMAPSGLNAAPQGSNSVLFTWNPVPGSVACRVFGRLAGMNGSIQVGTVVGPQPTSLYLQNNQLQNGTEIEWRVICACNINPLETTPFSLWNSFIFFYDDSKSAGPSDKDDEADDMVTAEGKGTVYPNPTRNQVWLEAPMAEGDIIVIRDISGQIVGSHIAPSEGSMFEINMSRLASGVYFIQHTHKDDVPQVYKVIKNN